MHFDIKVAYAAVICHSINTCEFNSANAVISSTKRQQHWVCLGTKEAEEFDIIPGPVPPNIQQGCCHLFIIDFRLTVMWLEACEQRPSAVRRLKCFPNVWLRLWLASCSLMSACWCLCVCMGCFGFKGIVHPTFKFHHLVNFLIHVTVLQFWSKKNILPDAKTVEGYSSYVFKHKKVTK